MAKQKYNYFGEVLSPYDPPKENAILFRIKYDEKTGMYDVVHMALLVAEGDPDSEIIGSTQIQAGGNGEGKEIGGEYHNVVTEEAYTSGYWSMQVTVPGVPDWDPVIKEARAIKNGNTIYKLSTKGQTITIDGIEYAQYDCAGCVQKPVEQYSNIDMFQGATTTLSKGFMTEEEWDKYGKNIEKLADLKGWKFENRNGHIVYVGTMSETNDTDSQHITAAASDDEEVYLPQEFFDKENKDDGNDDTSDTLPDGITIVVTSPGDDDATDGQDDLSSENTDAKTALSKLMSDASKALSEGLLSVKNYHLLDIRATKMTDFSVADVTKLAEQYLSNFYRNSSGSNTPKTSGRKSQGKIPIVIKGRGSYGMTPDEWKKYVGKISTTGLASNKLPNLIRGVKA